MKVTSNYYVCTYLSSKLEWGQIIEKEKKKPMNQPFCPISRQRSTLMCHKCMDGCGKRNEKRKATSRSVTSGSNSLFFWSQAYVAMLSLSMGVMTWIQKVGSPGKIALGNSEVIRQHHQCNEHEFQQTPGDGEGQGNVVCCGSQGHKESDTT